MPQRNVANGKVPVAWCDSCGTILLGDRCSVCGSSGREFEINSPGDVRPCMGDSKDMVLGLFSEAFGTDSPLRGKALFLNKVPGEDRADEVVASGAVIAVVGAGIIGQKRERNVYPFRYNQYRNDARCKERLRTLRYDR